MGTFEAQDPRLRPLAGTFQVPPGLRPQVAFWRAIFSRYSRRQVLIHDTNDLRRVYSVLDYRDLDRRGHGEGAIEQALAQGMKVEKERIRALLVRLHNNGGVGQTEEERRIAALFAGSQEPRKFLLAADENRVRGQQGIRERFARGIEIGHRYFPEMERIFREEGVPVEITRLPLIESTFNIKAYSKVGAAGVWQFMPATGRQFMKVDDLIDERRDPIISARAAARFLKDGYRRLGAWPLAITGYNHGPGGVARAVKQLGTTDIVRIIHEYDGPAFRFASRNFYPEFLAALEVEQNKDVLFGRLALEKPVPTDTVRLPHFVDVKTVATCARASVETVAELNPSFSQGIVRGEKRIPRGYAVRIPAGRAPSFERQYAALPASVKHAGQKPTFLVHKVQRGQTLSSIARRYGVSTEQLRRYNKLRSRNVIRVGQQLRIPL